MKKTVRERMLEHRLRKTKRQCIVLGAAAVILSGILGVQALHGGSSLKDGSRQSVANRILVKKNSDGPADKSYEDDENLLLVNWENGLPDDYDVKLHWLQNRSCAVAEEIYEPLRAMLTDGSTQGRNFVVASGYRSSEQQQSLLDEDIAAAMQTGLTYGQAYEQETKETMPPGFSEHQSGLAVDIVSLDYQILDRRQADTKENIWLRENCSKYGFILRYPEDGENITKINYEPWHFRYVGQKAAEEIMKKGITLEEYLGEE